MAYSIPQGRLKPKKEPMFGKKPYKGKDKNRKGDKKECVSHSRLKPKVSIKNKKILTSEDKKYLEWLQSADYACMVCYNHNCIEWHHVKEHSTDTKNHKRLIPLCGVEHHRLGTTLSAHGTPKKFREMFSMEFQNQFADEIYSDYAAQML